MFVLNKRTIEEIDERYRKAITRTAIFAEWKIKEKVRDKAFDTGDLLRSITHKIVKNWNNYEVKIWSNHIQAWISEYWRRPWRFPNLDALVWWAWRHWIQKDWITKTYDELNSKAKWKVYVLARSIAKKGIKNKQIFKRTLEENKGEIGRMFANSFEF